MRLDVTTDAWLLGPSRVKTDAVLHKQVPVSVGTSAVLTGPIRVKTDAFLAGACKVLTDALIMSYIPRKARYAAADWTEYYDEGAEGEWGHPNTRLEVRLHTVKTSVAHITQAIVDHYENYLGPAAYNQRIVIAYGGFGWAAQELLVRGFTDVTVADLSEHIQAEKDNNDQQELKDSIAKVGLDFRYARGKVIFDKFKSTGNRRGTIEIVNADIMTEEGRDAIFDVVGNPQIVVTEDYMHYLNDSDAIALSAACQDFGGIQTVAHLVRTTAVSFQDPRFNWKSLSEWKTLISGDIWIDYNTGEVL
jgi:hypothetical protein